MSIAPTPAISPQDLLRLSTEGGVEFVDGQVVEKPVSIESSEIEATITALLHIEAKRAGSARVFGQTLGYRVYPEDPRKFRKPDVSVVRSERLTTIDSSEGFMPIPADLVVEVLSPNDLAYDVTEKVDEYLQHGFGIVWVVHPNTRSVAIYRADGTTALLHESDEITGETALPTFRCKVAEFFDKPRP